MQRDRASPQVADGPAGYRPRGAVEGKGAHVGDRARSAVEPDLALQKYRETDTGVFNSNTACGSEKASWKGPGIELAPAGGTQSGGGSSTPWHRGGTLITAFQPQPCLTSSFLLIVVG